MGATATPPIWAAGHGLQVAPEADPQLLQVGPVAPVAAMDRDHFTCEPRIDLKKRGLKVLGFGQDVVSGFDEP